MEAYGIGKGRNLRGGKAALRELHRRQANGRIANRALFVFACIRAIGIRSHAGAVGFTGP
jgi:hypothetical protein